MPEYVVRLATRASRDLARFTPDLQARLLERIEGLGTTPRPPGCQKVVGVEAYRIRVGDHRVLYEIDDVARSVLIVRVRHRREVYRKLR